MGIITLKIPVTISIHKFLNVQTYEREKKETNDRRIEISRCLYRSRTILLSLILTAEER